MLISESVTLRGPWAGTTLKQVEAEWTEELVLSKFGLYSVHEWGWSALNKDSGIEIQWNYLNLFYFTVLEVSLVDFVANNPVNPGKKPPLADTSNKPACFDTWPPPRHHWLSCSLTISSSRNQNPPADEIPSVGGHYYFYILPCWSVGLIMTSAYQQTETKQIKMVASVLYFYQHHWLRHCNPSSSDSSSNSMTLYLHIHWRHRWARRSNSPSCHPECQEPVPASSTATASHEYD